MSFEIVRLGGRRPPRAPARSVEHWPPACHRRSFPSPKSTASVPSIFNPARFAIRSWSCTRANAAPRATQRNLQPGTVRSHQVAGPCGGPLQGADPGPPSTCRSRSTASDHRTATTVDTRPAPGASPAPAQRTADRHQRECVTARTARSTPPPQSGPLRAIHDAGTTGTDHPTCRPPTRSTPTHPTAHPNPDMARSAHTSR